MIGVGSSFGTSFDRLLLDSPAYKGEGTHLLPATYSGRFRIAEAPFLALASGLLP